ncbi:protogenin-like [Saccoglossus kowalevskii]
MPIDSRESDIIADEFDNRGGNLVIEDLSPFSSYMCYVLAYTSRGISPSSELVYFKMLEDVPSVAPTFTLSSNSPNIILIYWESIPSENRNGIIVSYKIFYRNEATTEQSVVELDSNLNYYLLNNLDGNTLYHIAMSASTNVGEGVKSEWSSRTTAANPDPTIPNAPVMELVQVNSSTVKVHWSMQLGNVSSPITGFKLYYASAKNEEHRTGPVMLPSNAMMYVLSGLSPSTRYFVELLAYNQIGDGRDATGYVETSDLSEGPVDKILPVPPYPNINNIVPLNSTAIYLSWDKPQTMLTIVCYTLRVTPLYTANATMVRRETSNLRQYVLNSLKPFTRYLIAIKAHTPTTESRFSLDESVDTPQDKPWSAPVNVLVKEHSTHSVVIQWSPPDLPNGIITRYIILYNVNTTLPEDLWDKDEKEGTVTKSIINNLQLGYEYYFVMKASTKVGEGPATAPIPFKMPGSYSYDINTEHPTVISSTISSFLINSSMDMIRPVSIKLGMKIPDGAN